MNNMLQLLGISICFSIFSLSAVTFKNSSNAKLTIQSFCWVFNYVGNDPYRGRYCQKVVQDPCDAMEKGKRAYAFLQLLPVYLEPKESKDFKELGLANLCLIVDHWERLKEETYNQTLNKWMHESFQGKSKPPVSCKVFLCPSLALITNYIRNFNSQTITYEIMQKIT